LLKSPTKQPQPGTAPLAGILEIVCYFIAAVYLCLGNYSAAALAPQEGVIAFNYIQNHHFIMFYRILQRAMRPITISNTIRNQNSR
jgi:hypothetical protein